MRHPISGCPPEFIGFSPNSLTVKMEIEMTNPCPSCVETIADLKQAVSDAIHNAYVSGALDVHNNYQEDRDPSFGEAAADYVASLGVEDILAHFLPKSPAQALAEECPHGMTVEQAQWVLERPTFQDRVQPWLMACFGEMIAGDREERNHRFLEEALELVQACGCTASEAHQLVAYVYGRPTGEPFQEVGGVMVTLAALCLANGLDMHDNGETELDRIWTKVEAIRAKQAAKPKHSPLPETTPTDASPRYVFGPWVDPPPARNRQTWFLNDDNTKARRAYRVGQPHPHDGGECPLVDGSARVYSTLDDGSTYQGPASERQHCWPSVVSFIPIDEGKGS